MLYLLCLYVCICINSFLKYTIFKYWRLMYTMKYTIFKYWHLMYTTDLDHFINTIQDKRTELQTLSCLDIQLHRFSSTNKYIFHWHMITLISLQTIVHIVKCKHRSCTCYYINYFTLKSSTYILNLYSLEFVLNIRSTNNILEHLFPNKKNYFVFTDSQ